ncbi:MAG: MazG nucleotide pyrophosphohydrolase domain-containing protein [Desulfurococcaceae archaeon]
MELREAQNLIRRLYYERDSSRGLFATFTWLVEEVGELAEAVLKMNRESAIEEIADVLAWLLSVANLLEIDVEEAFKVKYVNVSTT